MDAPEPGGRARLGNRLLRLVRSGRSGRFMSIPVSAIRSALDRSFYHVSMRHLIASLLLGSFAGTGVIAILNAAATDSHVGLLLPFAFVALVIVYRIAQGALLKA